MKNILTLTLVLFLCTTINSLAQTVYSSAKGEKYHTGDCRLSGEAGEIKLTEAKKAGKTACGVCKPDEWIKAKLVQCEGKTKDNARCKRMTANKDKKCFQHQSK